MERATIISIHPPPEHFGDAQRNTTALQFPKFAVAGAEDVAPERELDIVFHLLLLLEAPPLYAVKLLPAVVATLANATPHTPAQTTVNKIFDIFFISLFNTYYHKHTMMKSEK